MQKLRRTVSALTALVLLTAAGVASGQSASPREQAGAESHELMQGLQDFADQRAAPAAQPPAAAWAAAANYVKQVPAASTTRWTEMGPYNYQSDDPSYPDPYWGNYGNGSGFSTGRITALAALSDGQTVFAGAAGGGVWKSTDAGLHWAPKTDSQDTLSTGAIAVEEHPGGYTVYVGTGEANTNQDAYAGVGVLRSTDGGNTWSRMGGDELLGATIYRILVDPTDHTRVYAATSHGLYRWTGGATAWQRILGSGDSIVANMVTDVVVRPGTGGATGDVVAVVGWRSGSATNGLFESQDGGDTFAGLSNPQGYVPPNAQGRVSLAYAGDGTRLYAVVQDPTALLKANANTVLQGVYVSNNGDPHGPFTKIANSSKLMNSGSAMKLSDMGRGYQPGIQAWYDQFVTVDPENRDHLYVGLEEVYETLNGGSNWTTVGAYWNYTLPCYSAGTCPATTHPDQHAIAIAHGTVWVGNDGGVWSRQVSNHQAGGWTNLNRNLNTLQFYYAGAGQAAGGPLTIYGGLQDNGTAKVIAGQPNAFQPFGGDGGDVIVDPSNPDNVMTEYVDLTVAKSRDGGHSWTRIAPSDPNPRFIAPFRMDPTNKNHLVAGGQYVWESTKGFDTECNATACDWQIAYDQGSGRSTTALNAVGSTTYAAWCGPCNPDMSTGVGFQSGIATNYGGTWHQLTPPLATRYATQVSLDSANPAHAYVTYSGYSRHWMIGPIDPGVGHVFETNDGGQTWVDISGDLVDAPANDVVLVKNHLVVATDVGIFVAGLHGGTWQRLGTAMPNTIVNDLTLAPKGDLIIAATHGRGLWSIPTAAVPNR